MPPAHALKRTTNRARMNRKEANNEEPTTRARARSEYDRIWSSLRYKIILYMMNRTNLIRSQALMPTTSFKSSPFLQSTSSHSSAKTKCIWEDRFECLLNYRWKLRAINWSQTQIAPPKPMVNLWRKQEHQGRETRRQLEIVALREDQEGLKEQPNWKLNCPNLLLLQFKFR